MTSAQILRNLYAPSRKVDVVIDTDAYNEIDDQFAIAYLLKSPEFCEVKAIYAAPFTNDKSTGPEDGMIKSYNEILKLLDLMERKVDVFKGSTQYLKSKDVPVISDAALDLVARAKNYSPENPLYVVGIAAITNIASAIIIDPSICENIVIVWLGGHGRDFHDTNEFNMSQDIVGVNIVFDAIVPFIQVPCRGVASGVRISRPELEYWLLGKNKLCDYLVQNTIQDTEKHFAGTPWSRSMWDSCAAAFIFNKDHRIMAPKFVHAPNISEDLKYIDNPAGKPMSYIYYIHRDLVITDMIRRLVAP